MIQTANIGIEYEIYENRMDPEVEQQNLIGYARQSCFTALGS